MTKSMLNLGRLAEDFIQKGAWNADAISRLDDSELDELLDHLVARAAVETAADDASSEPLALDAEGHATVLSLQSFYLGEVARSESSGSPQQRLARPATWLAIEPVLHDRDFLIRLGQRRLPGLAERCVRDLADLLGFSRDALRVFFAGTAGEGLAVAENRSSGKPQDDGSEDFQAALARSGVPDVFKRRWTEG